MICTLATMAELILNEYDKIKEILADLLISNKGTQILIINISFTLLLLGRGNLVLKYSISHFPLNSGGIAC